jgi:hypothetical protein
MASAAPVLTTKSFVAAGAALAFAGRVRLHCHKFGLMCSSVTPISAHAPCAGGLTLLTSSLGLLTTASKSADGSYAYNSATVPFLAESLKLTVSMYLLRSQQRSNPEVTTRAEECRACHLRIRAEHWAQVSSVAEGAGDTYIPQQKGSTDDTDVAEHPSVSHPVHHILAAQQCAGTQCRGACIPLCAYSSVVSDAAALQALTTG